MRVLCARVCACVRDVNRTLAVRICIWLNLQIHEYVYSDWLSKPTSGAQSPGREELHMSKVVHRVLA